MHKLKTYIHTYIHTYMKANDIVIYKYTYSYIRTGRNTCIHTVQIHNLKYIHTYIHTYTHTCLHTYIHTYIHTFIHIFMQYPHTSHTVHVLSMIIVTMKNIFLSPAGCFFIKSSFWGPKDGMQPTMPSSLSYK